MPTPTRTLASFSSPITMLLLTETTLFHWDLAFDFLSHRFQNAKKDFSGPQTAKKVQMWMDKITTQPPPPQAEESSASNHSYATSLTNFTTTSEILGPQSDGLGYRSSDAEASDSLYYSAPPQSPQLSSAVSDIPCSCGAGCSHLRLHPGHLRSIFKS